MVNSLLVKPSARQLLARILDEAALVAEVRALPPRALAKLIEHIGLEDAGEIVHLATAEQIERVFDEDLWKSTAPGEDEVFDADRFVMWLEILLEAGDRAAARRLAELSSDEWRAEGEQYDVQDVITLAFHRLVTVIDVDELVSDLSEGRHENGRGIDRAIEGSLNHEIGSFMVIARKHDGWDAIVTALVALDEEDHALCTRLLDRCAAMSTREADDEGGLYAVLTAEASFEGDVAGDRADRRAREGFVAPSDARSFLSLTKESSIEDIMKEPRDPVTRAYFREIDRRSSSQKTRSPDVAESAPQLLRLLEASGVMCEPTPSKAKSKSKSKAKAKSKSKAKSLATRSSGASSEEGALGRALRDLSATSPAVHAERMEELAYLVNVLVAGDSFQGRAFRPGEAATYVVEIATRGLEHIIKATARDAEDILAKDGVVMAFRVGLHVKIA